MCVHIVARAEEIKLGIKGIYLRSKRLLNFYRDPVEKK